MIDNEKEITDLQNILKNHPKGLTIAETAVLMNLNRISTSKYLNFLLACGMAEMRVHGPSKVYYPSSRIPISSILNFSTSLLLVMNDNLSILDANKPLLKLFSVKKKDLIGHRIEFSSLGEFIDTPLLQSIRKALDSTEDRVEVKWTIRGDEKYLSIKITPTVFEDGNNGVALIIDDVTELTRYRKKLEQLVDERSLELKLINEQLVDEIKNHKKARIKLQKSEQKYRDLIENASSLIIKLDNNGNILFFNEFAEQFLGYSEKEILGKNIFKFIPDADPSHDMLRNYFFKNSLHADNRSSVSCEVFKKDKTKAWISWTTKYLTKKHGKEACILIIGNDITDLKNTENALIESEGRYRTLYFDNPSMYFTLDCHGIIVSVNSFGAIQLGYEVDELEGQSVLTVIYPEDHHKVLNQLQVSQENPEKLYHWEFRKVNKAGNILWVKEDARTVTGSDGISKTYIVCQDITTQKLVEKKLASIINFLPDATFVIDSKGVVIAWNQAIEELSGVKASEIIGKGNFEYAVPFYGVRRPILIDYALNKHYKPDEQYQNLKKEGEILTAEGSIGLGNGNQIITSGRARCLYDDNHHIIGAIESFRDITEIKNTTNALKESEVWFRELFDQAFQLACVLDLTGRVTHINLAALDFLGKRKDEVIHTFFWESFCWSHDRGIQDKIRRSIKEAVDVGLIRFETTNVDKAGNLHNIDFSLKPFRNEKGEVSAVLAEGRTSII